MLHRVGEIDPLPADPRLLERAAQHVPSRSHERLALEILLVAGLLAHEHEPGVPGARPEDGLRRLLPQVARLASGSGFPKFVELAWSRGRPRHL
jgi:hypothetical protein